MKYSLFPKESTQGKFGKRFATEAFKPYLRQVSYLHDPDSLCFAHSFFLKLTFWKKTLWYHLRRLLNDSLHTLFQASGPKTYPVQSAKKIIVKLYTTFKIQEPKNHTPFSSTYILYTCLGQIKECSPLRGLLMVYCNSWM